MMEVKRVETIALSGEHLIDALKLPCGRRWLAAGGVLVCHELVGHDGACAGDWLITDWSTQPKWMDDIDLELRWCYFNWVTEHFDRLLPHRIVNGEAQVREDLRAGSHLNAEQWAKQLGLRMREDAAIRKRAGHFTFAGNCDIVEREWTDGWERLPLNPEGGRAPKYGNPTFLKSLPIIQADIKADRYNREWPRPRR